MNAPLLAFLLRNSHSLGSSIFSLSYDSGINANSLVHRADFPARTYHPGRRNYAPSFAHLPGFAGSHVNGLGIRALPPHFASGLYGIGPGVQSGLSHFARDRLGRKTPGSFSLENGFRPDVNFPVRLFGYLTFP